MPVLTPATASSRGFTLIELVTVMLLVGILAVVALPRINFDGFAQQSYARELSLVLRHAQKVATAARCPVQVTVSASGYSARYAGGDCGTGALTHPSRGGALVGSGSASSTGSVTFDDRGRSASGLTITLTNGYTITVHAGSGYVQG